MGRFVREMNPLVRGLLIIAAVAAVIVVLQLYQTLVVLTLIAQIGFLLAIALFVYLVWRERARRSASGRAVAGRVLRRGGADRG